MHQQSHPRSTTGFLVMLSVVCSLLLACSMSTSPHSSLRPAPPSQQVLRLPLVSEGSSDIATMDPALDLDTGSYLVISLVFPPLVTLTPSMSVEDWMASSVAVSSDGMRYSFHIPPGRRFSDGEPIDAYAFAYAINRSLDPCVASPAAYYLYELKDAVSFSADETCASPTADDVNGAIKTLIGDSIVAPDAQTLTLTLRQPAAYFLEALTYPTSFAVPRRLVQTWGSKWTDHLVDNGGFGGNLFKLVLRDHVGHITLERNDAYWGTKPTLREIDLMVYKNGETAYSDYLTGRLDVGFPTPEQYAHARTLPGFHEIPSLTISYLAMNWKDPPFDDLGMRQAFALAINKQLLADRVLDGIYIPTNHIVPQGMPGYNPNLVGVDGTTNLTGNPAKATQLEQAYVQAHCSGKVALCPKVTFTGLATEQVALNADQAALQMWQDAFPGYPISIETVDGTTLSSEVAAGQLQFWPGGWTADYPDPQDWLSLAFLPTAPFNYENVRDVQASALMTQADADHNESERLELYAQAEQLLVYDVAEVPIGQDKFHWQARPYVINYAEDPQGVPSLDQWLDVFMSEH